MKKFICILGLICLLFGNIVHANNNSFTDLPDWHWAYNAVNVLRGTVIDGYPDGTFRPNNEITRVEFAKIVVNSLQLEDKSEINYLDVTDDFWGKEYIQKVTNYFSGYQEENGYMFYPNELAKREDMAVALVKATGLADAEYNLSVLDKFTDKDKISSELKIYMAIAVEHGIINGYDDNTIRPQGTLTRAEATQLVFNVNYVKVDKSNSNFVENSNDPKLESQECETAKKVFQEFVDEGKTIYEYDDNAYSNNFDYWITGTCMLNGNTCFVFGTGVAWRTGITYLVDVSNGEENAVIYVGGYNEITEANNIRIVYKKACNKNKILLKKIAQEVYNYIPNINDHNNPCAYQSKGITNEDLIEDHLLYNAYVNGNIEKYIKYDEEDNCEYQCFKASELQKVVKRMYGKQIENRMFGVVSEGALFVCDYQDGEYTIKMSSSGGLSNKDDSIRDIQYIYIEGDNLYIIDKYLYISNQLYNEWDGTYYSKISKYYSSSDKSFEFINEYEDDDELKDDIGFLFYYGGMFEQYIHTFKKAEDGTYYWYSTKPYDYREKNILKEN